jgi:hypothetical protein
MKLRSKLNYATQYASAGQGFALNLEMYPFIKQESVERTFVAPSIGTQGSSTGGTSAPSTDISAGTDDSIQIAVDGGTAVTATISSLTGLNTGPLIAAALETTINSALSTAGQDAAVWVEWSTDHYVVYSQFTGSSSSIVITDATSNNLADDLELGTGNGGTEAVGTDTEDFLFTKSFGFNPSQENNQSEHRSGRQGSNTYRSKRMVEGTTEMYCLLGEEGGDIYLPTALETMLTSIFGRKVSETTSLAVFDMGSPHVGTFSAVSVNNIFSHKINGGYAQSATFTASGTEPVNISVESKASDAKTAFPAQINGIVSSSASVIVNTGEAGNFEADALVMVVAADGVTVTAGGDGSLSISAVNTTTDTLTLSTTVDAEDDGFLVPWYPIFGGIPNDVGVIATDLQGSLTFGGKSLGRVKSWEIGLNPNQTNLDEYYGTEVNQGRVDGARSEITVSITMDLTAEDAGLYTKAKRDEEFAFEGYFGNSSGQHWKFVCPKLKTNLPPIEFGDEGPIEITFEAFALQTAPGALDAIKLEIANS